uniref:Uncharacterized protein n=1 Tax=Glossina pallidipes TaxID=7398 RepID=A0A1B0A0L5_GLOPL
MYRNCALKVIFCLDLKRKGGCEKNVITTERDGAKEIDTACNLKRFVESNEYHSKIRTAGKNILKAIQIDVSTNIIVKCIYQKLKGVGWQLPIIVLINIVIKCTAITYEFIIQLPNDEVECNLKAPSTIHSKCSEGGARILGPDIPVLPLTSGWELGIVRSERCLESDRAKCFIIGYRCESRPQEPYSFRETEAIEAKECVVAGSM